MHRIKIEPGGGSLASPQITIITPCLNAEAFLSEALESVQNQDFKDIEHIVLDGGSTDGSLNILNTFPGLRILSETDQGSHHAMNKGLELAKGDIIGFLNGDDTYEAGVFTDIAMHFAAEPDLDMLCGGDIVFRQDRHGMRQVIDRRYRGEGGLALSELLFGAPAFNARFYRRRLFERIGNFDLTFDFSADRDFLIRAALAETRSISYEKPIYNYRTHSSSRTLDPRGKNKPAIAAEHIRMAEKHLGNSSLTKTWRKGLHSWCAFESLRLVLFYLAAGKPGDALSAWRNAKTNGPRWIPALLSAWQIRQHRAKHHPNVG